MGFLAIGFAYTMRICLSIAITEMVMKPNITESANEGHSVCPADPISGNSSESVSDLKIIRINFRKKFHNFVSESV